ncbi:uncharacterized protein LOC122377638 [Amphibalanus amphitrite]|uniref:uncharacterized protein LOC122377638 n=1 Tax=Amphibalanus amphitrite TaxID=1232801 RepID=UPI001C906F28|nr:uncharacterized protein LOC122377638 [Amphibalanus amphitrite]
MSVPFSFHAVGKVRENLEKGEGFTRGNAKPSAQPQAGWFPGQMAADLLQSYSSKMMKAIWGQYNRYSVHNFKSNQALPLVLAAQSEPLGRTEQAADTASAAAGLLSSQ